jgi:hypothetical protein
VTAYARTPWLEALIDLVHLAVLCLFCVCSLAPQISSVDAGPLLVDPLSQFVDQPCPPSALAFFSFL